MNVCIISPHQQEEHSTIIKDITGTCNYYFNELLIKQYLKGTECLFTLINDREQFIKAELKFRREVVTV